MLDASCSASNDTCSALMSQLAGQIRLPNTCGPDLARGQPLVTEALMGFQNYNLYREAGCQKSNSTGRYCFAEASAQSDPDELYFYYLVSHFLTSPSRCELTSLLHFQPEGTSLPSGTTTGCEPCTQGLLQIYASVSGTLTSRQMLTSPSVSQKIRDQLDARHLQNLYGGPKSRQSSLWADLCPCHLDYNDVDRE